jgi:diguanylate cyclase (GGDEF)-like protein
MNAKQVKGEILKNVEIFQGQSDEHLDLIAAEMKKCIRKSGNMLFREGDSGDELFIILSGKVSVFITDDDKEEVALSELGEGSYFGEMSIIDKAPRSASCRVIEDGEFLVLHSDDFFRITRTLPGPAVKIMNNMLSIIVGRLMSTGAFITQMVQWGEESRKRAITDPATGLFNRRYLEDSFESLFNKTKTERSSLTFVMFDMDRFGTLNNQYGQEFCDGLIVECAAVFKTVFAPEDILVRYGGDEFIFLLPGSNEKRAQIKCDNLCKAIREMRFAEHDELRLTCSMGFAAFPENATTPDELKERADKALYMAKEGGRDMSLPFREE